VVLRHGFRLALAFVVAPTLFPRLMRHVQLSGLAPFFSHPVNPVIEGGGLLELVSHTASGVADDGNKRNQYRQTYDYDTIGNIAKKTSYNHLTPGNEKPNVLNYTFNYLYTGVKPHAPAQIGNWTYTYDANGNLTKKERLVGTTGNSSKNDRKDNGKEKEDKSRGKKDGLTYGSEELNNNKNKVKKDPPGQEGRSDSDIEGGGTSGEYIWNEENRLVEAKVDGNGKSTYFLYDYKGDRTIKRGQGGETLYVNEYYQLQNQNIITKHIFVGSTRIVSKLTHYSNYDSNYEKKNTYTYHPDHLGSSNFVTDPEGNEFEHMEYTPYGESWVDEGTNKNVIGYRFTSKELDTETGLYYFGARYLDPLTSRWVNTDPALEMYLPSSTNKQKLPGLGGVFNSINLNLYHYASNNPLKYVDPNGYMPAPMLRTLSTLYQQGYVSDRMLPEITTAANFGNIWTAFHEIAQINIANQLSKQGFSPILEFKITSKIGADVVAGDEGWEVKPITGKDPKRQLEIYENKGGLKRGHLLTSMTNIYITDKIKMEITFPKRGEARYSFYKMNEEGQRVPVTVTEAAQEYSRCMMEINQKRQGSLMPGGMPVGNPTGIPVFE